MKLTKRDVDDVYRLDFGPGTAPIILSEEEMDELRAHLQAERDQELGWWRDPEEPDWVVRPHEYDNDTAIVYNERTRYTGYPHRSAAEADSGNSSFIRVAKRYFATHPDEEPRKPRHDAKAGEYWLVTLEGADPIPTTVGNYCENLYFVVGDDDYYCPTNDHRIQNAVRLTPEDGDCGISEPTKEGGQ